MSFTNNFMKFVPKVQINNISALVQIMAWPHPGNKPLSEAMLACYTDTYMRHLAPVSESVKDRMHALCHESAIPERTNSTLN